MSTLRAPVKTALRSSTSATAVERMWTRIEAKSGARRSPARRIAFALAAGAAIVVALFFAWTRRSSTTPPRLGPVLLANGAAVAPVSASSSDQSVLLDDGTTLVVHAGASLEPLVDDQASVVFKQGMGRVSYDVHPGGPRRWTIECAPATVEVVGTSFDIERGEGFVRVDVSRGIVLVRSDALDDHVVRLTAGMHVEVRAHHETAEISPSAVPSPETATASSSNVVAHPVADFVAPTSAPAKDWRSLAAKGEHAKAYDELGPGGVASESKSASVDDLFALADVARLSGHPAEAVDPLQRIVAEHASDPRMPLAALTLGRIRLRSLGMPAAAAQSLQKSVDSGLAAALAEDAFALWIEALARSGDRDGAKRAYDRLVARFPGGARNEELKKWLDEP